jgi:hypothetical protein
MVGGVWQVVDGRHRQRDQVRARFVETMQRLSEA